MLMSIVFLFFLILFSFGYFFRCFIFLNIFNKLIVISDLRNLVRFYQSELLLCITVML